MVAVSREAFVAGLVPLCVQVKTVGTVCWSVFPGRRWVRAGGGGGGRGEGGGRGGGGGGWGGGGGEGERESLKQCLYAGRPGPLF